MKRAFIITILSIIISLALTSCLVFQKQTDAHSRWVYIMNIRHPSKDIALSCMGVYDHRFSSSPPSYIEKANEFKNFSVFASKGTVDIDESFIPQTDTSLHYVTNEVSLSVGESIIDFNGFEINAVQDGFVVSNSKKSIFIPEKHDWSEITSNGSFLYGGHMGPRNVGGLRKFLWNIGLVDSGIEYTKPENVKKYRYLKWCISPIETSSNEFEVYTIYIPARDAVWRKRKVWFQSEACGSQAVEQRDRGAGGAARRLRQRPAQFVAAGLQAVERQAL